MTLRLTVDAAAWERHVRAVAEATPGLVPVVKGNGYGFGRTLLFERAAALADTVAVGTIHEIADLDRDHDPTDSHRDGRRLHDIVVLTPTLHPPAPGSDLGVTAARIARGRGPILTVGSLAHVEAIDPDRHPTRVLVKVATSMRRYGTDAAELADLAARASDAGLDVVGVSLHLPLAGTDAERVAEISEMLGAIDPAHEVWLSHLGPAAYAELPSSHRYRLRLGTSLWHGDKSMLHLTAEVLDARPAAAGSTAGYRRTAVPGDGTLVMIGAGTAHGVQPLADGRSPFHHRRRRLDLLEPPHMHTSMAFVPAGSPVPAPGERVDVQRPLITTTVDEIEWR